MFNNLKSKLKGFFKKTPQDLEEKIYEDEEKTDIKEIPEAVETAKVEPEIDVPKLSRRERIKAEKEKKKESIDPLEADFGKKIKDKDLDNILDELEIILLEADVAFSVAEIGRASCRERV